MGAASDVESNHSLLICPSLDRVQAYARHVNKTGSKDALEAFKFIEGMPLIAGGQIPLPQRPAPSHEYECSSDKKRLFPDSFQSGYPEWVRQLLSHGSVTSGGNRTSLGDLDLYMYRFFFSNLTSPGTFVEVGGYDGLDQANTYVLERQLGWSGVLIEADSDNYQLLEKNRGGREGVTTIHAGVCAQPRMIHMDGRGIMSASQNKPGKGGTSLCLPLSVLVQAAGLSHIDFLSLDVEGNEFDVLAGHDFGAVPIDTILIETLSFDETNGVNACKRWALHKLGYCRFEVDVGAFVVTNEVWISKDFVRKRS